MDNPTVDYDKILDCLALLTPVPAKFMKYAEALTALSPREQKIWLGLFAAYPGQLFAIQPHLELVKRMMKADPAGDAQNVAEMAALSRPAREAIQVVVTYLGTQF